MKLEITKTTVRISRHHARQSNVTRSLGQWNWHVVKKKMQNGGNLSFSFSLPESTRIIQKKNNKKYVIQSVLIHFKSSYLYIQGIPMICYVNTLWLKSTSYEKIGIIYACTGQLYDNLNT